MVFQSLPNYTSAEAWLVRSYLLVHMYLLTLLMLLKSLTSVIPGKTWNWHFTYWITYVLQSSLPHVNRLVFCVYMFYNFI